MGGSIVSSVIEQDTFYCCCCFLQKRIFFGKKYFFFVSSFYPSPPCKCLIFATLKRLTRSTAKKKKEQVNKCVYRQLKKWPRSQKEIIKKLFLARKERKTDTLFIFPHPGDVPFCREINIVGVIFLFFSREGTKKQQTKSYNI